jgi:ATP-dependent protease ClpP protease subunit
LTSLDACDTFAAVCRPSPTDLSISAEASLLSTLQSDCDRRELFDVKRAPAVQRFTPSPSDRDAGPWELAIAGELNDKSGEMIDKLLEVPLRSTGIIYFDSGGGSAYAGLALASVIRLRGLEATGVVAGECSSAAILPLAACKRRFVTAHASLFFHPMRWQSEEDVRLEEAAEWARHFKILEEDLDALVARMFGVPVEIVSDWTRPGRFLSGTEFAAAGLATLVDLFSGDLQTQIAKANT